MTPNKKPTLTQRVTRLEGTISTLDKFSLDQHDAISQLERRAGYTEIGLVEQHEQARKAEQDARYSSIISTAALALSVVALCLEAFA